MHMLVGHCLDVLATMPSASVHCCVTSPPYWSLRDYGLAPTVWGGDDGCEHVWGATLREQQRGRRGDMSTITGGAPHRHEDVEQGAFCQLCGAWRGQLGLEPTPELYVEHLVAVFREVRRVLRDDGTCWLTLGDSYATGAGRVGQRPGGGQQGDKWREIAPLTSPNRRPLPGLKAKDLVGIPWRVALALQADGWWLRSDIVWHKPNCMPESVRDRPTKAHEYVFLLSKRRRYYYDAEAIRELSVSEHASGNGYKRDARLSFRDATGARGGDEQWRVQPTRNARSVWTIPTTAYRGAHFATMALALAERCILAGTSARGACPKCGAPWKRRLARGLTAHDGATASAYGGGSQAGRLAQLRQAARERGAEYVNGTRTIGWAPTCGCDAGEPVGCMVLDPFGGAGSTALAALQNGRRCTLIELNPDYAQLAQRRLEGVAVPMATME